jgi:hypothetical protein
MDEEDCSMPGTCDPSMTIHCCASLFRHYLAATSVKWVISEGASKRFGGPQ